MKRFPLMASPVPVSLALSVALAAAVSSPAAAPPEEVLLVDDGRPLAVSADETAWTVESGTLEGGGTGTLLVFDYVPGAGDFQLTIRLALASIDGTAASVVFNGSSHFGFDSRSRTLFVEGPLFGGGATSLAPADEAIAPGKPFLFTVTRRDDRLTFAIDGRTVHEAAVAGPIDLLALRPHRNRMAVRTVSMRGDLVERPEPPPMVDVYISGADGYHTYRIPAIVRTAEGTLLAFCEGRKNGRGDSGDIDMLVKRSRDGGRTWSPFRVIWDDRDNTCGNPAPVVDRHTGTIWLLMTWNLGADHESQIIRQTSQNTRRVFVTHSTDDGLTWTPPEEITASTKQKDWTWYATGPGHGIQLTRGPHAGRLVIPCDHIEADTEHYYSHVIYSDDHGRSWQLGGSTPDHQVNECTVAELADGRMLLNMRNYDRSWRFRQVAVSPDGGMTWQDQHHDETLIEPICQASLLRWSWPEGDAPGRILFSNPASQQGRIRMTVRVSTDEGRSWADSRLIYSGGSAYSDLVRLSDTEAGLLFEKDDYGRISFVPLSRAWLEGEAETAAAENW